VKDGVVIRTNWTRAAVAASHGGRRIDKVIPLDKAAHLVLADAKKFAPVLTGALRASGRVRRVNQHRRAIEFGGRGTGVNYARAIEFGTFRTRPQPFLRRSLIKNRKQIKKVLGVGVSRILSEVAKQGGSVR
jgi:HK97 gp10 family phage protein